LLDYKINTRQGWIKMAAALFVAVGLATGMWLCCMGSDSTLDWSECLLISGPVTWLVCMYIFLRRL